MSSRASTGTGATVVLTRDSAGIGITIDRYADGLHNGNVETLKQAFRPEAILAGYLDKQLAIAPVQSLYDFVSQNDSPAKRGDKFAYEIVSIKASGSTAVVHLSERAYLGFNYETSFHMVKVDGRWWIVSKLFSGTPVTAG